MKVELTEEGYTLDGKWKLVPIEVNGEMESAYDSVICLDVVSTDGLLSRNAYKTMIAASPKPDLSAYKALKAYT